MQAESNILKGRKDSFSEAVSAAASDSKPVKISKTEMATDVGAGSGEKSMTITAVPGGYIVSWCKQGKWEQQKSVAKDWDEVESIGCAYFGEDETDDTAEGD